MNFVHAVQKGEASAKGYPKVEETAKEMKPSSVEHFMGRGHIDKELPKQANFTDYFRALKHTKFDNITEQHTKHKENLERFVDSMQPTYFDRLTWHKATSGGKYLEESHKQANFTDMFKKLKHRKDPDNHLDEKEDANLIKKLVKPEALKKEAFIRGFIKAAKINGLSEYQAINIFKLADQTVIPPAPLPQAITPKPVQTLQPHLPPSPQIVPNTPSLGQGSDSPVIDIPKLLQKFKTQSPDFGVGHSIAGVRG
jgi:hypothetical protein